jgi:hypothetical protein
MGVIGHGKVEVVNSTPHCHSRVQVKGYCSISLLYFPKLMYFLVMRTRKQRYWVIA